MTVQSNGSCVYSSYPPVNFNPAGGAAANQFGSYTMSHVERVACDVIDPEGNNFQVCEKVFNVF